MNVTQHQGLVTASRKSFVPHASPTTTSDQRVRHKTGGGYLMVYIKTAKQPCGVMVHQHSNSIFLTNGPAHILRESDLPFASAVSVVSNRKSLTTCDISFERCFSEPANNRWRVFQFTTFFLYIFTATSKPVDHSLKNWYFYFSSPYGSYIYIYVCI